MQTVASSFRVEGFLLVSFVAFAFGLGFCLFGFVGFFCCEGFSQRNKVRDIRETSYLFHCMLAKIRSPDYSFSWIFVFSHRHLEYAVAAFFISSLFCRLSCEKLLTPMQFLHCNAINHTSPVSVACQIRFQ